MKEVEPIFLKNNFSLSKLVFIHIILLLFFSAIEARNGGTCKTKDNKDGICKPSEECPSNLLSGANQYPRICFFRGRLLIICCPNSHVQLPPKRLQTCKTRDEKPGICKLRKDCLAELFTGANWSPKVCHFEGNSPLLCCPSTSETTSTIVATDRVDIGSDSSPAITFECGKKGRVNRIGFVHFPSRLPRPKPLHIRSSVVTPPGSLQPCKTRDEKPGICKLRKDCLSEMLIGANWSPKVCHFEEDTPIVCCPSTSEQNLQSKGREKRQIIEPMMRKPSPLQRSSGITYIGQLTNDQPSPTIVGGEDADANEWPWMVLIGRRITRPGASKYFCDGVLINERFVLTAAHCLLAVTSYIVRFGEYNYAEPSADAYSIAVEDLIIHPEFKLNVGYHDLAIAKLSSNVIFKNNIRPICLPWNYSTRETFIGRTVTVTGWGLTYFSGTASTTLQEVEVKIFDSSRCHRQYSTLTLFEQLFPQGMSADNMLCAGVEFGGKDACQGDSGGPLMYEENGRWILGGIISKGHGCGDKNFSGLYMPMRNKKYLQWIKEVAFA